MQRRFRLARSKSGACVYGSLCDKRLHSIPRCVPPFGTQLSSYWPTTPRLRSGSSSLYSRSIGLSETRLRFVFFQVYRAKLVPCDQCQRQLLCPLVTGSDSNIHSILSSSSASTLSDSLTTQLNFVWLCRFVTIDSCISHAFVFCVSSSLSDSYGLRLSVTSVSERLRKAQKGHRFLVSCDSKKLNVLMPLTCFLSHREEVVGIPALCTGKAGSGTTIAAWLCWSS